MRRILPLAHPFGMNQEGAWGVPEHGNKYQYNDKELNSDFGLNLNDYGARWYDSVLARWTSVDPLADEAPGWTPYRYAFNSPFGFIDPDGLFEDEATARQYAKDNNIKIRPKSFFGKLFTSGSRSDIVENPDGSWSIDNKKDGTSISDLGGDLGVMTAALVTPNDIMSIETEGNIILGQTTTATLRDGSKIDMTPKGGEPPLGPGKFLKNGKKAKKMIDYMKGGKKAVRDRNFGINDKKFWKAWEKHKQKLPGKGRDKDIKSSEKARELYDKWKNGDGF